MTGLAINNENTIRNSFFMEEKAEATEKSVISLVKVSFEESQKVFEYYNDKFDLHIGDRVFVDGKMEGRIGLVVAVAKQFRINVKNYCRVIAHPTISFSGKFRRMNDKMVCLGSCCPSPEMFRAWISAENENDEEIVCGEPFSVSLDAFGPSCEISEAVFRNALEYCQNGNVAYIRIEDGIGTAFVKGTKWYEIRFTVNGRQIEGVSCDCSYPYLCKHIIAVVITLNLMFSNDAFAQAHTFTAIDRNFFWNTLSQSGEEINL